MDLSVPRYSGINFNSLEARNNNLYSIDLYTSKLPEWQDKLFSNLESAVASLDNKISELSSVHLLKSTDQLSCCIVGAWEENSAQSSIELLSSLDNVPEYSGFINEAKKFAIRGTYSDLVQRCYPNRMYFVADLFIL